MISRIALGLPLPLGTRIILSVTFPSSTVTAAARIRSDGIPKCFMPARITHSLVEDTAHTSQPKIFQLESQGFHFGENSWHDFLLRRTSPARLHDFSLGQAAIDGDHFGAYVVFALTLPARYSA